MNKESLIKARKSIIDVLDRLDINKQDKAELIMNLWILLDYQNYDYDIDVLKRYSKQSKQKRR